MDRFCYSLRPFSTFSLSHIYYSFFFFFRYIFRCTAALRWDIGRMGVYFLTRESFQEEFYRFFIAMMAFVGGMDTRNTHNGGITRYGNTIVAV